MANRKAERSISLTLPIHYVAKHFSLHNSSAFNIYNKLYYCEEKRERNFLLGSSPDSRSSFHDLTNSSKRSNTRGIKINVNDGNGALHKLLDNSSSAISGRGSAFFFLLPSS